MEKNRPRSAYLGSATLLTVLFAVSGGVPWGLDRIDQRTLPLDGRFEPGGRGTGVHAYVIDTGVRKTHRHFGARVDWVGDFVGGAPGSANADDCDPPGSGGHGTHVASILGGQTYGVAPAVRIHALRILPCGGTTRTDRTAAVRAVDWITAHGQTPAVVNLSPARWETTERDLDEAIQRSIAAGFVYVVSAGGATDLGAHTPQRVAEAIVVAATAPDDRAPSHEYGPTLTLFAPGVRIEAAGSASDSATFVGDGDSYAAPFVAGVVALYLEHHPAATPSTIKHVLVDNATRGVVVDAGSSPNLLLHIVR